MIPFKWLIGKSKLQEQKQISSCQGFEVEGESDYKEATWVNSDYYSDEDIYVKIHRLNTKNK